MTDKTITFAVGDIHGMSGHLHNILDYIYKFIFDNDVEDWKIVFTGDYIDRGPDSNTVVETIRVKQLENPGRFITLKGNHEQMLLEALSGKYSETFSFLQNGGDSTLESYGVTNVNNIPFNHLQFFRDTIMCYEDDLRYFVHAGINRSQPLSNQSDIHRLWIREGFLDYTGEFEKFIVHGHTIRGMYDTYDIKNNRLNIDHGAFCGGYLACAIFNNQQAAPITMFYYKP